MKDNLDIKSLKSFLDWTGCDLFFKAHPFLTSPDTVVINKIEDSKLEQWVSEWNKINSVGSDDVQDIG
tara:strand:+ start:1220 stop:1423 length:204 start_codon:yes stop_codon:yes gene_type:complete